MPNLVPARVALAEPAELAAAVPLMIGFHPSQSLIAVALRGGRDRMSFTMRLDLSPPETDAEVARLTAARMTQARADAVLLFVYTDLPGPDDDLPRRELVEAIADALDVPVRDAMLVDDGKVWSYLCDDPGCCPVDGRPMNPESPGALALAAAHALLGQAVLPDRAALVATTQAVGGITAESMSQATERALDDDARRGEDLLDDLCSCIGSPAALTHARAAELVVRLHDVAFRDRLISRLARGDELLERVVADVARLAQPPYDAPVASVLAMAAYFRGEGVVAMAAAERALQTDAAYSLAQLVVDCIARQVEPSEVRHVWLGEYLE